MFKKTIDVYWSGSPPFAIEFIEPDLSLLDVIEKTKKMNPDSLRGVELKKCASIRDYLKNTFRVRSPCDYNIEWVGHNCHPAFKSTAFDQKYFDENVLIRDPATGFLSLALGRMWFITEEPSLLLEQKHASYSSSDFSKNVNVLEGSFDLGKWCRPFDLAFFINHEKYKININRGDVLYYAKFHTPYKINFRRFHLTAEIENIIKDFIHKRWAPKSEKHDENRLEKYYRFFKQSKYKNYILKLVKQNALE